MGLQQKIYNQSPIWLKNILVTIYNIRFIKLHDNRYEKLIKNKHDFFFNYNDSSLKKLQNKRFMELIEFLKHNNKFFQEKIPFEEINSIADIKKIPNMTKDDLRSEDIKSSIKEKIIKGYTGGTTGKSLEFGTTEDDYIDRQASINFFRGMYGYKFKDPIAWFSGKEIITDKEENRNIFWVKDLLNSITYFSTFHLQKNHIDSMIKYLNKSNIKFLAGFPSAIYEIALRWKEQNISIKLKIKAIFPTSEPLYEYQKEFLEDFFNAPVVDQYASSEGAPFLYECPSGNLHFDISTGIFETFDEETNEVLVTSFNSKYMPLLRYKIGDAIVFDETSKECDCGSKMPLAKKIIGRSVAFVSSKERGKVTVSNISNVVKKLEIIDKFQLIQNKEDEINVNVVVENCDKVKLQKNIEYELRYRLGDKIKFIYNFVEDIPHEPNGKYMMIKNTLK